VTPEIVSLLRQSQILIQKMCELTGQLDEVTRAMIPVEGKRPKTGTPKELMARMNKRIADRDRGKEKK
jgi:hypothetical protein